MPLTSLSDKMFTSGSEFREFLIQQLPHFPEQKSEAKKEHVLPKVTSNLEDELGLESMNPQDFLWAFSCMVHHFTPCGVAS